MPARDVHGWRVPLFIPSLPEPEEFAGDVAAIAKARVYTNFGPVAARFEAALGFHFGCPPEAVVAVANATVGIAAALIAVAAGPPGSFCALPAWTHIATAAAVRLAGLRPWFIDVCEESWQLQPQGLLAALGEAPGPVAAVLCVRPFGARLDTAAWEAVQAQTGLPVVVDAAAGFDGLQPSRLVSVVSFHATKAFGIGEGGAVVASDRDVAGRIRMATNLGQDGARNCLMAGLNAKMDEYRAAIGLAALRRWPETCGRLHAREADYAAALRPFGAAMRRPPALAGIATSTFAVAFPAAAAADIADRLARQGIASRRWWGDGCHRAEPYAACPRLPAPVADRLARGTLGLPLYPMLGREQVALVAECLGRALEGGNGVS